MRTGRNVREPEDDLTDANRRRRDILFVHTNFIYTNLS